MIRELFSLAKAEGEGLGTAYEYYVKIQLLRKHFKSPKKILVYGLPSKYGYSLDHFYYAKLACAEVELLEPSQKLVDGLRNSIGKTNLDMPKVITRPDEDYGLILSTTSTHNWNSGFFRYAAKNNSAVFVPNHDNASHQEITMLKGFTLKELRQKLPEARIGSVDMPPFPPGIRKKGGDGAWMLPILAIYGTMEPVLPFKKRYAHLNFALSTSVS